MDSSALLRQVLRFPSGFLPFLASPLRPQSRNVALFGHTGRRLVSDTSIPRVTQPSIWVQMIPKFLRRDPNAAPKPKRSVWQNPATPFVVLSLLVGSQAIQTIWLKRDIAHFSRKADARIGILKEVIERVQSGEDVDVEKVLGTGDPIAEQEWEDVIKELAEEELLFPSKKARMAENKSLKVEQGEETSAEEASKEASKKSENGTSDSVAKVETLRGAKFY